MMSQQTRIDNGRPVFVSSEAAEAVFSCSDSEFMVGRNPA